MKTKLKLTIDDVFPDRNINQHLIKMFKIIDATGLKYKSRRKMVNGIYYEHHHIIPRHIFKQLDIPIDNSSSNLIDIPVKDHVLCHFHLYKYFHEKNDVESCDAERIALVLLFGFCSKLLLIDDIPIEYLNEIEQARIEYRNQVSKRQKGIDILATYCTEEQIKEAHKKQAKAISGENNGMFGGKFIHIINPITLDAKVIPCPKDKNLSDICPNGYVSFAPFVKKLITPYVKLWNKYGRTEAAYDLVIKELGPVKIINTFKKFRGYAYNYAKDLMKLHSYVRPSFNIETCKKIAKDYNDGFTKKQLQEKYGINFPSDFKGWCRRYKIKLIDRRKTHKLFPNYNEK